MITLAPAYCRDYKSVKAVKADIAKNKDFILRDLSSPWDGKICSPSDFKGQKVAFRYSKLTKITIVKI